MPNPALPAAKRPKCPFRTGLNISDVPFIFPLDFFLNKNTTKWNMSDSMCAPMACNIVANDLLKTA